MEWVLWAHVVGSCIVFNSTLKKTFLLLWKILFLCFTNLAKSLNVNFSLEMEARKLWLSRHKIQRLFGNSLAFFINTFCRVMAYKQLKWKTICRDYNFIKEEKTNKKAQHSNICRRNRDPNHSWFHTHQNGRSKAKVGGTMRFSHMISVWF